VSSKRAFLAPAVSPTQVWAKLSADLQTRTIALLAERALHLIVAGAQPTLGTQEVFHARQSQPSQAPA